MQQEKNLVSLEGILEDIVFTSSETHFTVGKLRCKNEDSITIVGTIIAINKGQKIKVSGTWGNHPKYGKQFQIQKFEIILPHSKQAIENYLSAHTIKGIGPKLAKRLVSHFGEKLWEILDKSPEKLKEIPGIGEKSYERIINSWKANRNTHDALVQLANYGIYGNRATKIMNFYGGNAMAILEKHPYRLAIDIDGIGFLTADNIAKKNGIDSDSSERIQAAFIHILQEAKSQGHCYLPQEELIRHTKKLLILDEVPIQNALEEMLQKEKILFRIPEQDEPIYIRYLYYAEFNIARILEKNIQTPSKRKFSNTTELLNNTQYELNLNFVEEQRQAILTALSEKISIITGGPGVGKTTIVKALVKILKKNNYLFALAAPTGRAAKRLSESSGCEAKTIHRLLRFQPRENAFEYDSQNPLELDHVIIDETSMVDIPLAYHLLQAIKPSTHITFVGDADQLPSVGPGNFLADMISSRIFPVVKLTHIFRQVEGSSIVNIAHAINSGVIPKIINHPLSDIFFMPVDNPQDGADLIVDLVTKRLPKKFAFDPKSDIQVITSMYRGEAGADKLNLRLADAINGKGKPLPKQDFREGDKVMQIVNNYDKDVYNGDIGIICKLNKLGVEESIQIDFGDARILEYKLNELDELVRSYAITIHKSQGSEYPAVIIPLFKEHYIMLERNLIYTAITRGKKLVVLVGEWQAFQIAIKKVQALNRYTRLIKYLSQGIPESEQEFIKFTDDFDNNFEEDDNFDDDNMWTNEIS